MVAAESEFGELAFLFFALGVEGRVDDGVGIGGQRFGEVDDAVEAVMMMRIHGGDPSG
jgi:hypothetical protein